VAAVTIGANWTPLFEFEKIVFFDPERDANPAPSASLYGDNFGSFQFVGTAVGE
jgi:hypothetical protein